MIEKKFYGERLRSARMYRGLTLTELAKRTEISKQSLSLYENDNNTPDYMKVRLLASELNFPYDYFFQNWQVLQRKIEQRRVLSWNM